MACALIGGFVWDCIDSVGGIREIKVRAYPTNAVITSNFIVTSGIVAITTPGTTGWYTYFMEDETGGISDVTNVNRQQGTVFYQQEAKIVINKLTAKLRNELQVLAKNRLLIAVRDWNDNYWLVGRDSGAVMSTGSLVTGVARGDRSGSEMTFVAKEVNPINNMTSATYDALVT